MSPLKASAPGFVVETDFPQKELRFSPSCECESQETIRAAGQRVESSGGGGDAELGPLGVCSRKGAWDALGLTQGLGAERARRGEVGSSSHRGLEG